MGEVGGGGRGRVMNRVAIGSARATLRHFVCDSNSNSLRSSERGGEQDEGRAPHASPPTTPVN